MRLLLIFLLGSMLSSPAVACRTTEDLTNELKGHADLVFEGEAVAYTPSKVRAPGKGMQPAVIEFKVAKQIKGEKRKTVKAHWINGTFGESRSLVDFKKRYGNRVKVGLITPKGFEKIVDCRMRRYTNAGTGKVTEKESCTSPLIGYGRTSKEKPKHNWVVQGPCTTPFVEPLHRNKNL